MKKGGWNKRQTIRRSDVTTESPGKTCSRVATDVADGQGKISGTTFKAPVRALARIRVPSIVIRLVVSS